MHTAYAVVWGNSGTRTFNLSGEQGNKGTHFLVCVGGGGQGGTGGAGRGMGGRDSLWCWSREGGGAIYFLSLNSRL